MNLLPQLLDQGSQLWQSWQSGRFQHKYLLLTALKKKSKNKEGHWWQVFISVSCTLATYYNILNSSDDMFDFVNGGDETYQAATQ